mgnify:FL=1
MTALTAPCVPTGMNAGVWTTPWAVCISPRRARPSVSVTWKRNVEGMRTYYERDGCRAPSGGATDDGWRRIFAVSYAL